MALETKFPREGSPHNSVCPLLLSFVLLATTTKHQLPRLVLWLSKLYSSCSKEPEKHKGEFVITGSIAFYPTCDEGPVSVSYTPNFVLMTIA